MSTTALLHRQVSPGGVHVLGGWPLKLYVVGAERLAGDRDPWREQAMQSASDVMAEQPRVAGQPAAGFLVLHHGAAGTWLLIDWWREDILHQSLLLGHDPEDGLGPPPPYVLACVFELVVTDHERRAWARHVLGERPDVEAYLADVVEVEAGRPYPSLPPAPSP